jgi:hypothetical protein
MNLIGVKMQIIKNSEIECYFDPYLAKNGYLKKSFSGKKRIKEWLVIMMNVSRC